MNKIKKTAFECYLTVAIGLVLTFGFSTVVSAAIDCQAIPEQVATGGASGHDVAIKLAGVGGLMTVCKLNASTGVAAETCRTWYATALTALTAGKTITMTVSGVSSCNALPTASWYDASTYVQAVKISGN